MLIRCLPVSRTVRIEFINHNLRKFHSLRTVASQSNDCCCCFNQTRSNHRQPNKTKFERCEPLNGTALRIGRSTQANFATIQNRFFSTEPPKTIAEAVKSSVDAIKKTDETEIDLANFQIPNLPTPEEIEALKSIISAADVGLTPWMPTGWLFNLFDYIHKQGVEWPVTIIISTIIIRTIIFPLVVSSRKQAAEMGNTMRDFSDFQKQVDRAQLSGNLMELNKIALKFQNVMNEEKMGQLKQNKFRVLRMPLTQLFLFTSFFITLRKMCYYPIPSLHESSLLWLPSLAEKDPYYVLPIVTSATLFVTLRLGIDTGTLGMTTMNKFQRAIVYVLPIGSLVLTYNFPSALCLYWCTSNFHSLLTAYLLKMKPVREYFEIPEPPKKPAASSKFDITSIIKVKDIIASRFDIVMNNGDFQTNF